MRAEPHHLLLRRRQRGYHALGQTETVGIPSTRKWESQSPALSSSTSSTEAGRRLRALSSSIQRLPYGSHAVGIGRLYARQLLTP